MPVCASYIVDLALLTHLPQAYHSVFLDEPNQQVIGMFPPDQERTNWPFPFLTARSIFGS